MSLLVAWLAFPLLLGALALGCGLLAERLAGARLPGVLLLPLGLAVIMIATQIATNQDATAELATPGVLVLAACGFLLSRTRLRALRPDGWAAAAALAVFAVFAAPVVLSGDATFAGYNLNGEPSIHFIGIDRLMEHGRSVEGLAPSSYEYCLDAFFGNGYPSGSQTALGSVRPLVDQDVAWVYQPFIVFLVAMVPLSLYAMITPLVERRPQRALATFIAAQPALVYGFSLQGSVKELSALYAIALLVALVPWFATHRDHWRSVIGLAIAAAAGLAVLNVAIAPWLGLIALAGLLVAIWGRARTQWRLVLAQAAMFVVLTAALSYPALLVSDKLVQVAEGQLTAQENLTAAEGLGNLIGPLHKEQALGIWLEGDYRKKPGSRNEDITNVLLVLAVASALIGIGWALRRRALGPLLYVAVSGAAGAYVVRRGSPWGDAKALMIGSPAALLAISLGPVALWTGGGRRRRTLALLLGGAVTLGVLCSNLFAYHDVNLAPRDRLEALADVGERISGQGPTLYTEFEEYGKHFLRDADPEGRSEGCQRRFVPLRDGQLPRQGFAYDLDQQTIDYVLYYRSIVLRRSPSASRPPAPYRRTFANDYYEVWQRPSEGGDRVLTHVPLGDPIEPGGRYRCGDLRALGAEASRMGGRIAYSARPRAAILMPAVTRHPPDWIRDPSQQQLLIPTSPGRVRGTLAVPSAGRYTLWLGGSFGRGYEVSLDGRRAGEVSYELNGRDQYARIADVELTAGEHEVELVRGGGDLHPGNGGLIRLLGPIVLEPSEAQRRDVEIVPPSRAGTLCGKTLDWVEVIRPA